MAPRKKRQPTIEERLEATVQTLELLASMQMRSEANLKKLEALTMRFAKFTMDTVASHHRRIKKLEAR